MIFLAAGGHHDFLPPLSFPSEPLTHPVMKKTLFILTVLSSLLLSCSQDDAESMRIIRFQAFDYVPSPTRGTQVSAAAITSYGVSCAAYPSGSSYTSAGCGSYFFDEAITAASGTSAYYWPASSNKVSFYAYTPYGNGSLTLSSLSTKTGYPVYSYTVPQAVASQVDFMTADTVDIVSPAATLPVRLYFRHRLVDLRFKVTNQHPSLPLTVKSISVVGMKYAGTFENPSWTLTGSANTVDTHPFYFAPNTVVSASATVDITSTANHFMVLPQTIYAGTTFLKIVTTESGVDRVYTHILPSSLTFIMSKSYCFTLILGDGVLIVDEDTSVTDWVQDSQTVSNTGVSVNDWEE